MSSVLWPLLSAFGICALLHWAALRVFPWLNLLDFPDRYGLKRRRLPYPTGGLAILTFLGCFAVLQPPTMQSTGLVVGIAVLGTISFLDDRTPLPWWIRLGAQVLVAFIIFGAGTRIFSITNPLAPDGIIKLDTIVFRNAFLSDPPLWSGLFTILWLGITINALNWFDGIPGQVSTLSAIGFLVLGFLSLSARVDQPELAALAFVLAGIAFACLLFDFPPPKVLMGDTGAMFFGLMLGVLTIYAGGKVATGFLVLGVPLIDSAIVVARRVSKGQSPFQASQRGQHLHHRLLAKGWSGRQVIALTASLGTLFGVTALFLSTSEKFIAALVLVAIMLGLDRYTRPKDAPS